MLISEFDPWKSKLCTCPRKFSFSPYTGCSHACVYCYISSYIPNPFKSRVKKDVFRRLRREVNKVDTYISMANSSDPYPPEEKVNRVTRGCLNIFRSSKTKVLILTKSDIVLRDVDILRDMDAAVSFTITTLDSKKARMIEPNAPSPQKRLHALQELSKENIPCIVRIDPIILGFNDNEIEKIVEEIHPYAAHVVASTIKPRRDSLKRLKKIIDFKDYRLERREGAFYLPENLRFSLLERVENICKSFGLSFAACREGYPFKAKSCDGSHLIFA
ncbi:MAG TPA: radical SAM protein [Thermoplasmatales archaeon]|nr:radical SAM protein [Thermoplasmatales archaeon]